MHTFRFPVPLLLALPRGILFDEGAAFSALAPTTSAPLLTVSTPVGLQMGENPGPIINSGIVYTYGLDKTAALLGSEVLLFGGGVYAENGHIELGSIGAQKRSSPSP